MKHFKILVLLMLLALSCSEKETGECNPDFDCKAFKEQVESVELKLATLKENDPQSDSIQWYEEAVVNWNNSFKEYCGGCKTFSSLKKKAVPTMPQYEEPPVFASVSALCPPWWSFAHNGCCSCKPKLDFYKTFVYSSETLRLSIERCEYHEIHPHVTRILRLQNIGTVPLFTFGGVPINPGQITGVRSWGSEDCIWQAGDFHSREFNYSWQPGRLKITLEKVLLGTIQAPTTTGTVLGQVMPGYGDSKEWYVYP